MDTRGKAKQKQRRHFDKSKVGDAMKKAGETAGITVKVDQDLASIERDYIALDDESFVSFGQRMAREVGGTFKIVGTQAILAKRNGGKTTDGKDLPAVTVAWGVNLHDYDIKPLLGRPVQKKTRSRWYDRKAAKWKHEEADTGTEGGETVDVSQWAEADETGAKHRSSADAAKRDRASGEGTVTIEGDITAQPEGTCLLVGCRPGVDGTYRIESVDHEYSRAGWTTRLQLRQPKGSAGKDKRGSKSK
jgi:hypothetical protein